MCVHSIRYEVLGEKLAALNKERNNLTNNEKPMWEKAVENDNQIVNYFNCRKDACNAALDLAKNVQLGGTPYATLLEENNNSYSELVTDAEERQKRNQEQLDNVIDRINQLNNTEIPQARDAILDEAAADTPSCSICHPPETTDNWNTTNYGNCFTEGTKVLLQNVLKNIEDIVKNDIVLSYNEKTQENEYSLVIETMKHEIDEEIYSVYINNKVIKATGNHKFYIKRDETFNWIMVSDLLINDEVRFSDGTLHKIDKITNKRIKTTVYNIEVDKNHNYYVGEDCILVHNKR